MTDDTTAVVTDGLREALFEAITDADDWVFQARETLDQCADESPDDDECARFRGDSQQLHDAWKTVKVRRDAYRTAIRASLTAPQAIEASTIAGEGEPVAGDWREVTQLENRAALKGLRRSPKYYPAIGETCRMSGPNCDDADGYTWLDVEVLWRDDLFVVTRVPGCWPTVTKLELALFEPRAALTPATPAPAAGDVERHLSHETVCGFKVAAYRETHPEHGAKYGHAYCEHWSTPNTRDPRVTVERLFTEDQLRSALAAAPVQNDDVRGENERLREALKQRDGLASECPDTKLDPDKDCPRCGASSNEGCRITALADAGFVHAARAALSRKDQSA